MVVVIVETFFAKIIAQDRVRHRFSGQACIRTGLIECDGVL